MANPPIGNNFIEGVLGVVRTTFNGVDMGKSEGEATLEFIEDIKDIFHAQDGTQPADKIPTGQAYQLTVNYSEITWARLQEVMRGLTIVGNNAKLEPDLYRSGLDNFAKRLEIIRVDSAGAASGNDLFKMVFYKAFPQVNGPIGAFGPDTQRTVEVIYYMFRASDHNDAFGYAGNPSSVGL